MRALVSDPIRPQRLAFAEVPSELLPTSSQALIEVHAVSLTFGEVGKAALDARAGERR